MIMKRKENVAVRWLLFGDYVVEWFTFIVFITHTIVGSNPAKKSSMIGRHPAVGLPCTQVPFCAWMMRILSKSFLYYLSGWKVAICRVFCRCDLRWFEKKGNIHVDDICLFVCKIEICTPMQSDQTLLAGFKFLS